jgi:hypothetical protein
MGFSTGKYLCPECGEELNKFQKIKICNVCGIQINNEDPVFECDESLFIEKDNVPKILKYQQPLNGSGTLIGPYNKIDEKYRRLAKLQDKYFKDKNLFTYSSFEISETFCGKLDINLDPYLFNQYLIDCYRSIPAKKQIRNLNKLCIFAYFLFCKDFNLRIDFRKFLKEKFQNDGIKKNELSSFLQYYHSNHHSSNPISQINLDEQLIFKEICDCHLLDIPNLQKIAKCLTKQSKISSIPEIRCGVALVCALLITGQENRISFNIFLEHFGFSYFTLMSKIPLVISKYLSKKYQITQNSILDYIRGNNIRSVDIIKKADEIFKNVINLDKSVIMDSGIFMRNNELK